MKEYPLVLPVRKQAELTTRILRKRLDTILPVAMREADIDMWLIICQEDDYDPVFKTMIPMNTWAPILQILAFYDRGAEKGIERTNLAMTDLGDLFDKPWKGTSSEEQWKELSQYIVARDPKRIGINIGSVNWAAGGLTYNLYRQLLDTIPSGFSDRLVSAENACNRWLMTLSEEELDIYPHVVAITKKIIAECFSSRVIMPGVTTTEDLEWEFWQRGTDLGLEQSFLGDFSIRRSDGQKQKYPLDDKVIRRGDLIHCDVGNRYLRLNSDLQEWVYILREGETDVPPGMKRLLSEGNRLQKVFMHEFKQGLTGNQLLANILATAKRIGIPGPRVYSHSLGLYLHEPGPLIGLPWEQANNPGRGDVQLQYNTCFTMELAVEDTLLEWDEQKLRMSLEQDVCFTQRGCEPMAPLQTEFFLV
jgi:Xaa-Pro aminopeptidase